MLPPPFLNSGLILCVLSAAGSVDGEDLGQSLTLRAAVRRAVAKHPRLRSEGMRIVRSEREVDLARTGYLPSIDVSLQFERGTGNVLRGSIFSMRGIPSVSGPPTGRQLDSGAFGTTVGVSTSWDVLGLISRMAIVDQALDEEHRERAAAKALDLDVGFLAADRFLEVVARSEAVRAAQANVDRARVLERIVHTLAEKELRPEADDSRAKAERALAETLLIRANQAREISNANLAEAIGEPAARLTIDPGTITEATPDSNGESSIDENPHLAESEANIRAAEGRKTVVSLTYLPRLDVVAALWARGSGLTSGILAPSPADGLVPDTPNWAAGLVLSWPALELLIAGQRARVAEASVEIEAARKEEVWQSLATELERARAELDGAKKTAMNTPIALDAARAAEKQASARYQAGLASVVEVAEAQRLLAQAEIDDALARVSIHRARLHLAYVVGDLGPFLTELKEHSSTESSGRAGARATVK
jgi:outer membrane protein TolC